MPLMRRVAALGAALAAARRYARQNPDKVNRYADQAASFVDRRTHGRYRRHIDSALRQVRKGTSLPGEQGSPGHRGDGRHGEPTRSYPSYRVDRPR